MFSKVSIVALLASVAAAQHAPVGEPLGNPITRPLNEVVPACKPFTITWTPTTTNTVSILLLRGPSSNVVPIGAPIVVGIPNSGSFVWTPSAELEADVSRYGIQLIDDVNGQYQYSTQFGISKDDCAVASSSVVAPSSAVVAPSSAVVAPSSAVVAPSSAVVAPSSSAYPTFSSIVSTTTQGYGYGAVPSAPAEYETATSEVAVPTESAAIPSLTWIPGTPHYNTTLPTKSVAVPSSLRPSPTNNGTIEFTGAADAKKAGLTFVGAFAALAYFL